jgi:hypothetical protein
VTWLLNRLFDHQNQPTPRFAFQGTVNWMRALSILVDEGAFSHDSLRAFYRQIQRRQPNQEADTLTFGCLLMALHNVSSIQKAQELDEPYSFVRLTIVAWYYAIYYASKSMIAAATGSDPQTHSKTGKIWQTDIAPRRFAVAPFDFNFSNLTPANIEQTIAALRGENPYGLSATPTNREQAYGAAISYLKGTAEYKKERLEKEVKDGAEFKRQGFKDFKTKAARALRDEKLSSAQVNFLVQAHRYRGKANYRDAIYLSYGADNSEKLTVLIRDLAHVARAFTLMAAHYLSRRVSKDNWQNFINDVRANARFPLPYDLSEI